MSSPLVPTTLDPEHVRTGATLRQIRELRGLKVGELSNLLGISYAYLSNIEAGRKPLTDTLAAKASEVLKIRPIVLARPDLVDVEAEVAATA